MRDEVILDGLRLISQEINDLQETVISDLRSKAPQTTIQTELRWGLFNYKKQSHHGRTLDYGKFLQELFKDFASVRHPEKDISDSRIVDLGEKWREQSSVPGNAVVHDGIFWVSFIPVEFERRIISDIQNEIGGEEGKLLTEFVRVMNSLPQDPGSFEATLAHEMTHRWMIKNTAFGQAYEEVMNSIMQGIENGGPAEHDAAAAENVLRTPEIKAIDEAFAYYFSYVYTGKKQSAHDLAFYDRPKTIEWGVEIIDEKAKRDNMGLDEVRNMMADVFQDIANQGQIRENKERRDPRVFFLKESLPSDDKQNLKKFKQISQGELSEAFEDLENALKDMRNVEDNQKIVLDLKKVMRSVDWENPSHIHDKILHSVLEDAVGNYSLTQIENEISSELQNEVKQLEKIQKISKKLVREEKSEKISEEVIRAAEELNKVEEDLKALY